MKKTIMTVLSVSLIAFSFLIIYGPSFLTCKDKPVKSDAVVLFLGDENKTREMEAEKLLREGYARYLIVPASGEVERLLPGGRVRRISSDFGLGSKLFQLRKKGLYKKHYEDTHIEVLEAKRFMDEMGLRSAVLVSSPYHMRRISLIAGKEFNDPKYTFYCVPTVYESSFTAGDWLRRQSRIIILSEYVKIGWFVLYGLVS